MTSIGAPGAFTGEEDDDYSRMAAGIDDFMYLNSAATPANIDHGLLDSAMASLSMTDTHSASVMGSFIDDEREDADTDATSWMNSSTLDVS